MPWSLKCFLFSLSCHTKEQVFLTWCESVEHLRCYKETGWHRVAGGGRGGYGWIPSGVIKSDMSALNIQQLSIIQAALAQWFPMFSSWVGFQVHRLSVFVLSVSGAAVCFVPSGMYYGEFFFLCFLSILLFFRTEWPPQHPWMWQ